MPCVCVCVGLNRENTYYTAITVPASILVQVISNIPVAALSLSGFQQNSVDDDNLTGMYSWTTGSLWVLRICTGVVTPIIAGFSYYLVARYPLSQKISDQINDAIRRKEEKKAAAATAEGGDDDRARDQKNGTNIPTYLVAAADKYIGRK